MNKIMQRMIDWVARVKRARQYKVNEYFNYVLDAEISETEVLPLVIIKGKYKGVIYVYDNFRIGDNINPDGSAPASYDVRIIEQPKHLKDGFEQEDKFHKITGDILLAVLWEACKTEKKRAEELLYDDDD